MTFFKRFIALIGLALCMGGTFAQSYPNKPIKVIVGYAAGGAVDSIHRILRAGRRPLTGAAGYGNESNCQYLTAKPQRAQRNAGVLVLNGKMESVCRAAVTTDYTDLTDFTERIGLEIAVRTFTFGGSDAAT